ncbi:hypothetical protein LSH36_100g02014 [Paralvinella palmiformis]|uniref:Uncharacterized protein n=1 Tax=Paralvinella palmiformis TaxID=53620 RepID=A0AAD9JZF5_9ANNE|nr:hypothetical protein LSH36_100g02014 [Paralvinella palmiformis]
MSIYLCRIRRRVCRRHGDILLDFHQDAPPLQRRPVGVGSPHCAALIMFFLIRDSNVISPGSVGRLRANRALVRPQPAVITGRRWEDSTLQPFHGRQRIQSILMSKPSEPFIVAEFCSYVVCSRVPSSEYETCFDRMIHNCWVQSVADLSNVPSEFGDLTTRRDHLETDCYVYDDCLTLSGGQPRRQGTSFDDDLEIQKSNGVLDVDDDEDDDVDDWSRQESNTKRWGERLRPVKKWSDRLTLFGKKWATAGKPNSPKRWTERLKIPARKWSDRLKIPGGVKRWGSRMMLPQKRWYDGQEEPSMEEKIGELGAAKKWGERIRPTKRETSFRVRRSAAGILNGTEPGLNSENDEQGKGAASKTFGDTIIGKMVRKRSHGTEWQSEAKKWADRILGYGKKWGSRIRPFEKKWGGRILPLAKKWGGRILPISTKKDAETPFIDYDNNIGPLPPSASEPGGAQSGRSKRWSERMYPHVLKTRQSSYSARDSKTRQAVNRMLFRRAWPRSEFTTGNSPFSWRRQSLGMW